MAAPPTNPPECTESDRPIRAGHCDMQSAVITALKKRGGWDGGRGTGGRDTGRVPAEIRLQTNMTSHARPEVTGNPSRPLHVAPAIKSG